MRIAVLGAGSWGTALAALVADAGHRGRLWGRDERAIAAMAERRENVRYLPGRVLGPGLLVTADFEAAVGGAELVVLALPTVAVRDTAARLGPLLAPDAIVLCAAKGIEAHSGLTLDRVLTESVPGRPTALLSGPTFAVEVARGLPTAVVVASRDCAAAAMVQTALGSAQLRVYTSDDVIGVAVGGAIKNVIAIAAGCADGLGFGANARAALITRGLAEMGRLAVRLGGNPATLAGLAGLGDLVLTCTGELSRNRRVGLALAAGEDLAVMLARLGQVVEGIQTAHIAANLARRLAIEMPITDQVDAVLRGRRTPGEAVSQLLTRAPRAESG